LGFYYKILNQSQDYLAGLERIFEIEPDSTHLRHLIKAYRNVENVDKQIHYLNLLRIRKEIRPEELEDLAWLYFTQKRYDEAVLSLKQYLKQATPPSKTILELTIQVLIDQEKDEEAYQLAKEVGSEYSPDQILQIADLFLINNLNDRASALVTPIADQLSHSDRFLIFRTRLDRQSGHGENAFQRLRLLYVAERLPDSAYDLFVDLLCEYPNDMILNHLSVSLKIERLSEKTLNRLVEKAIQLKNDPLRKRIKEMMITNRITLYSKVK
jgi:tetratricopeptide (TPR) repeat protein